MPRYMSGAEWLERWKGGCNYAFERFGGNHHSNECPPRNTIAGERAWAEGAASLEHDSSPPVGGDEISGC